MMFDLTGQLALVTGSSRGIGRAIAEGLAEAGATVVLHGRQAERVEAAAAEFRARFGAGRVHTSAFDVTDPEQVSTGIAAIMAAAGVPSWSTMRACSTGCRCWSWNSRIGNAC